MFDSIHTAMSGLTSFSHGLRTVSNNVSNMNTVGYRGFQATFSNLTSREGGTSPNFDGQRHGVGVTSLNDVLNMRPGTLQNTGESTDAAIDGKGFFVLRTENGEMRLTRDGRFTLRDDRLVAEDGSAVQAFKDGEAVDLDISSLLASAGKITQNITFSAASTLALDKGPYTAPEMTVFDSAGGSHKITLRLEPMTTPSDPDGAPVDPINGWSATIKEGEAEVDGSPFTVYFDPDGTVAESSRDHKFKLKPDGLPEMEVKISFEGVISNLGSGSSSSGNTQSVLEAKVDGNASGVLRRAAIVFDDTGTLKLDYTNGKTESGPQLALALVPDSSSLEALERAQFHLRDGAEWRIGAAGTDFGKIIPKQLEGSNVELSEEFSQLILHQRGYQAASEVITTANQMIDSLLRMRSGS